MSSSFSAGFDRGLTFRLSCWMAPAFCSPVPVTENDSPPTRTAVTVMRFSVMVPVLSEQMTLAQPRVSTLCSRFTRALRFIIRLTASASAMVTVAGSPSGMAAMANGDAGHEHIKDRFAPEYPSQKDSAAHPQTE